MTNYFDRFMSFVVLDRKKFTTSSCKIEKLIGTSMLTYEQKGTIIHYAVQNFLKTRK